MKTTKYKRSTISIDIKHLKPIRNYCDKNNIKIHRWATRILLDEIARNEQMDKWVDENIEE